MLHTGSSSNPSHILEEASSSNNDTEDFITRETHGASSAPNEYILHAAGRSFQDMSDNTYGADEDDVRNAANARDIGSRFDTTNNRNNNEGGGGGAAATAGSSFGDMLTTERKNRHSLEQKISGLTGDLKRTNRILDKERLLHRYERLNGNSSIPPEIGSMSAETLLKRVEALQAQRRGRYMIKVLRRMLCFGARLAELTASVMDKNSRFINLKGWCDSFTQSVSEYDHLLYDVYDYYLVDIEANPIMMLLYGVASNAAMYSMRQKFLQNPVLNAVRQAMYQPRPSTPPKMSSDNKHGVSEEEGGGTDVEGDEESSNASVHIDNAMRSGNGGGGLAGIMEGEDDDDDDALSLETRS